jgi:hypothetical protein
MFTDAQQMAIDHPDTFDAPSYEDLIEIRIGDNMKVCTGNERFWVMVTKVVHGEITGTVNNVLGGTVDHGLVHMDEVTFTHNNVYAIINEHA